MPYAIRHFIDLFFLFSLSTELGVSWREKPSLNSYCSQCYHLPVHSFSACPPQHLPRGWLEVLRAFGFLCAKYYLECCYCFNSFNYHDKSRSSVLLFIFHLVDFNTQKGKKRKKNIFRRYIWKFRNPKEQNFKIIELIN